MSNRPQSCVYEALAERTCNTTIFMSTKKVCILSTNTRCQRSTAAFLPVCLVSFGSFHFGCLFCTFPSSLGSLILLPSPVSFLPFSSHGHALAGLAHSSRPRRAGRTLDPADFPFFFFFKSCTLLSICVSFPGCLLYSNSALFQDRSCLIPWVSVANKERARKRNRQET